MQKKVNGLRKFLGVVLSVLFLSGIQSKAYGCNCNDLRCTGPCDSFPPPPPKPHPTPSPRAYGLGVTNVGDVSSHTPPVGVVPTLANPAPQ
jgi:hypothetical protein